MIHLAEGYHSNVRREVEPFLPEVRSLRVLELGCGEGGTGAWLKQIGLAREVVGVELFEDAAAIAETRLDQVFCADLNEFELPNGLDFDLVLALDVVEHLVDPRQALARTLLRLRRGGWLLTSTPNVRFWRVLFDLVVRGRWDYGANPVLDPTHLRFFTRQTIRELHEGLGMEVEALAHLELSGKRAGLDRLTRGALRDFLCGQHIVRSRRG